MPPYRPDQGSTLVEAMKRLLEFLEGDMRDIEKREVMKRRQRVARAKRMREGIREGHRGIEGVDCVIAPLVR